MLLYSTPYIQKGVFQDNKFQCIITHQAFAWTMLANVPLARESHMAKLSVNKQNHFMDHKYWKA